MLFVKVISNARKNQEETHLNFFKGFEYEPTVDWEAMMADRGMKEKIPRDLLMDYLIRNKDIDVDSCFFRRLVFGIRTLQHGHFISYQFEFILPPYLTLFFSARKGASVRSTLTSLRQ